jgi:DNA-binding CsgD family transcriptional regulator
MLEHQEERVGRDLRLLSRCIYRQGHNVEAERYAMQAIELLETLPPSRELAQAYGTKANLRMVVSDNEQTRVWGTRALALAQRFHDEEIESYVLDTIGSGDYCAGIPGGLEKIERSLELALAHGFEDEVARAYTNLADILIRRRDYAEAEGYLRAGVSYCAERDLDSWVGDLLTIRAAALLAQGDWAGASEAISRVLGAPEISPPITPNIPALIVLGTLRARRGDPGVKEVLDEAREFALSCGEMQHIAPVAAARAEWRWLHGDTETERVEAQAALRLAQETERPWYWGEVAIWLWRMGALHEAPDGTPTPFLLEIAGKWREAAATWEALGCPYEQALALMSGDAAAQQAALAIFQRLGARLAAEIVRKRLRTAGVRGLPRGPHTATRANPYGLTQRQVEILLLLAEGLRNAEIAERLSTTPKTVDHHVSAVLAKLGARSRAEAAQVAHELGVTTSAPVAPPVVTPLVSKM